ncbi:MAG: tRNA (guanosine(37)-N1)-methyltransferase TrmD [Gammaproteobacteria bacterium]|nr:tRNA (guanosine(37)-N1)-methyltransferase TrmD [Gammaproteobacteria bacterium]
MVNRFDVITLFPDMVQDACSQGVTGRAADRGLVSLQCWNPRDVTEDVHRTVDDRPYGGGPGMVMMAEPLDRTLSQVRKVAPDSKLVYLSPQGKPISQALLREQQQNLILLCGRYEGIDERFIEAQVEEEWSLGDFVLSGGEVAAIAVMDALTRLIPGTLGHEQSAEQDSFTDELLDCPHYTRPEKWQERAVPDVLMGGHHEKIERWRLKQSLGRTWQRRPDLLESRGLNDEERKLLNEFIDEQTD